MAGTISTLTDSTFDEEIAGYRWTPRWEVERLEQWRRRDVDHVIVNIDADPANLRRFGQEVIQKVA